MTPDHVINPLDAWYPHEPDLAAAQLAWLQTNVGSDHTLLDLGCGAGRTLVPMAQYGASCTGVDRDDAALLTCRQALEQSGASANLVLDDFCTWLPKAEGAWDVILCLGNTFCLIWQIEEAIALLTAVRRHLAPGGRLIVDDIPGDLWPELIEGRWQAGLDPDHGLQMVWSADDSVFTLRDEARADSENWEIGPEDVPLRLWTAGALHLAAIASGFEVPLVPAGSGVRVLRPVPQDHSSS
ncbi:MAG: methyltransferase domain-containing protein [Planctomycetota bacterium]|nr:methyltransferase domain-containing protein [Planctomycetota bacterium]